MRLKSKNDRGKATLFNQLQTNHYVACITSQAQFLAINFAQILADTVKYSKMDKAPKCPETCTQRYGDESGLST